MRICPIPLLLLSLVACQPEDLGQSLDQVSSARDVGIWYMTYHSQTANYRWAEGHGFGSDLQFVADVTGDEKADAVVYFASAGWYVARSLGDRFGPYEHWGPSFGAQGDQVFLADFTGDGRADAVGFDRESGAWRIRASTGGTFAGASVFITGHGVGSTHQFAADVTGDGRADAIVGFDFWDGGAWYVAPTNGAGNASLSFSRWRAGFGGSAQDIMIAQADGQAGADLISYDNGTWRVAPSTGASFGGAYVWRTGFGVNSSHRLAGDVDGDGIADPVVYYGQIGDPSFDHTWWWGAGGGSYLWTGGHGRGPYKRHVHASWVALGDVTGSGGVDAIAYFGNRGSWKVVPPPNQPGHIVDPAAINSWHAWDMDDLPLTLGTYRQYDGFETAVIDEHLSMISAAGIDYLIFDLTNHLRLPWVLNRALAVCERIRVFNQTASKPLRFIAAVGTQYTGPGWTAPGKLEEEAQAALELLVAPYGNDYFRLDGKPLLIAYTWTQARNEIIASSHKPYSSQFTVRWAEGYRGWQHRSELATGWWGWNHLDGTLYPPSGASADYGMTVVPGHQDFVGQSTSRYTPGGGSHYQINGWDRVLLPQNQSRHVVIASFNDYGENTAVAPTCIRATSGPCPTWDPTSEPWPSPDYYWQQTISNVAAFKNR